MPTWSISRLWFYRRSRRLKINIRRSPVHFRESRVCASNLDVQETNFSITQLCRSGNSFSWCRFTNGRYSRTYLLIGIWWLKCHSVPREELRRDLLQATKPNMHYLIHFKHTNVISTNIDHIPSNTMHLGASAMLYVFEDNEAVIKRWLSKVEVPQWDMFHGPTELLWIGCLTVILDPKVQIRYMDSKHQIADILTEGNFTRDERNNLLHLFIFCDFGSLVAPKISVWSAVLRGRREFRNKMKVKGLCRSRDEKWWIHFFLTSSSSAASSPIASKSSGMSGASVRPGGRMNLEASSFNAASAGQVRFKDAYLGGLKEEQQRY